MRIERLWVDVTAQLGATWADRFRGLELRSLGLDINNVNHLWLLHYIFLPVINSDLTFFVESWNNHTCKRYDTRELPKEQAARERRAAATTNATGKRQTQKGKGKAKTLNLCTYKWHSLPDYADMIEALGPSDGTTTQPVRTGCVLITVLHIALLTDTTTQGESEHKRAKRFFPRTSKRNTSLQLAHHNARERKYAGFNSTYLGQKGSEWRRKRRQEKARQELKKRLTRERESGDAEIPH